MKRTCVAALLAIVLCGGVVRGHQAGAGQASPGAQLEAAVKKEVVDGDLKAAIEVYRRLSQSSDRAVAAKALVRMGQCYEKLGAVEARQSYELVVSRFADQADAAAQARARLAALGGAKRAATVSVTKISDTELLAISKDGRYVAEGSSGEMGRPGTPRPVLRILDRATGTSFNLRKDSEGWVERRGAFSADGRELAYPWWPGSGGLELQVMPTDGRGQPRVVFRCSDKRNDKITWLVPFDWTPDGKSILVLAIAAGQNTTTIALIDITDGRLRELRKFEGGWSAAHPEMSPDGAYVVYSRAPRPGDLQHDIMILSVSDLREWPLVENPADDSDPLWTPDGKSVLFRSNRRGTVDLWLQGVAGGKPNGEPQMVRGEMGAITLLGVSASGALAYSSRTSSLYAYTASLDPASGKAGKPVRVGDRTIAPGTPFWSPDGRTLAVLRPAALALLSVEAGTERELPLSVGSAVMSGWFPDGGSVLISGTDGQGHDVVVRYYVDPPRVEQLPNMGARWRRVSIGPDGKVAYGSLGPRTGEPAAIVRFDLSSGERKVITTAASYVPTVAVSPDGRQVAYVEVTKDAKNSVVWTVAANGGTPKQVATFPFVSPNGGLAWTPDGKYVLLVDYDETTKKSGIRRVSTADGTSTPTGLSVSAQLDAISLSPDGRRLAFRDGATKLESWTLENFLPQAALKPASPTPGRKNE